MRHSQDCRNREKAQYLTKMEKKNTSKKPEPPDAADKDVHQGTDGARGQPQAGDEEKGKNSLSQMLGKQYVCFM